MINRIKPPDPGGQTVGKDFKMETTVKDAIREIVETADFAKYLPHSPTVIEGHPLDHHDRWTGGHGKFFGGKHYSITNIRMTDGSAKNPHAALLTYQDGDLICDLVEEDPNIPDPENLKKLVAMAYYMGRESASREICDEHNTRIAKARDKAKGLRYHIMANGVLDAMGGDMIYSPDYAGDMTDSFGRDPINILE